MARCLTLSFAALLLLGWSCLSAADGADEEAGAAAPAVVSAGDAGQPAARGARVLKLLGGAAVGLASHETGHLTLDLAVGVKPVFKGVDFHGVPFFALTYRDRVSSRQEYAIAAAGFWAQGAVDEWILTARPRLRHERAPFLKGVLLFHVATSVGYAGAALRHTGPGERDTRGMAPHVGVDERWVGLAVLTPAALDSYRYLRPQSRGARWASRVTKLGLILLVLR